MLTMIPDTICCLPPCVFMLSRSSSLSFTPSTSPLSSFITFILPFTVRYDSHMLTGSRSLPAEGMLEEWKWPWFIWRSLSRRGEEEERRMFSFFSYPWSILMHITKHSVSKVIWFVANYVCLRPVGFLSAKCYKYFLVEWKAGFQKQWIRINEIFKGLFPWNDLKIYIHLLFFGRNQVVFLTAEVEVSCPWGGLDDTCMVFCSCLVSICPFDFIFLFTLSYGRTTGIHSIAVINMSQSVSSVTAVTGLTVRSALMARRCTPVIKVVVDLKTSYHVSPRTGTVTPLINPALVSRNIN